MKILGLNYIHNDKDLLFNDAAAALIINGNVVGNYEEERFNRIKHSPNIFPFKSIEKLLLTNNIKLNDIDIIGVRNDSVANVYQNLKKIDHNITNKFIYEYSSHHESHIYNAYYQSGFKDAAALVIDGDGNLNDSITIAYINNGNIQIIRKYPVEKSLGNLYEFAASFCGFDKFGEGKFMGLASYGNILNNDIIYWNNKTNDIEYSNKFDFLLKKLKYKNFQHYTFKNIMLKYFENTYYPYKKRSNDINELIYYKDFAATIQHIFSEIILNLVKYTKSLVTCKNLLLCGGCIQNCNTNELIVKSKIFDNIYAAPNSHDAGEALGNALYAAKKYNETISLLKYNDKYYNLKYDITDIDENLKSKIKIQKITQQEIINDLKNNKIIGWFQDGSEIGHRALCHRSIIANPSFRKNLNVINNIKQRELFRPLAPVVPDILFNKIFTANSIDMAEYMFRTIYINSNMHKKLQAICHIDGTTRPQLLTKETNEYMYNLILNFYKQTDIPCLINTSFNKKNEPIVESINDAINTLLSVDLDYIVFNTLYKIQRV